MIREMLPSLSVRDRKALEEVLLPARKVEYPILLSVSGGLVEDTILSAMGRMADQPSRITFDSRTWCRFHREIGPVLAPQVFVPPLVAFGMQVSVDAELKPGTIVMLDSIDFPPRVLAIIELEDEL